MQEVGSNLRRRDWPAAEALAARARGDHPGSWLGPWLEGVVDQARGQLDAAETRLLESLTLFPLAPGGHQPGGGVVAARDRLRGGSPRRAGGRGPGLRVPAADRRPDLPRGRSARPQAEATARRMLAAAPGSARPYGDLATLYLELDRPSDALQICDRGWRASPAIRDSCLREARSKAALGTTRVRSRPHGALLAGQPDHHLGAARLGHPPGGRPQRRGPRPGGRWR